MATKSAMSGRTGRLATEVAQAILCHMPDARSLMATASSSAQFLRCFNGAEDLIVRAVLYNEFGSRALPDALAAQHSANLWPFSDETRKSFMSWWERVPESTPSGWSLHDSMVLSGLRDHVEYFVTAYAQSLSSQLGIKPSDLRPREVDRMRCAFYRFETFCNLFGKRGRHKFVTFSEERKAMFIDRFVPWETEQLACVYEFLFATLSVAFSDVGEHDIEMGAWQVPWRVNQYPDNRCQEHYLSLGLGFLHELDMAKDYEARYEVLFPIGSDSDREFLHQPLELPSDLEGFDHQLKDLSDSEVKSFYPNLRDRDENLGPFRAWKWAHADALIENDPNWPLEQYFYFEPECRELRTKGYVFFDEDRVWTYFVSHGPHEWWNPDTYLRDGEELPTLGMEESIEKRTAMWEKGWRGYWSEHDQSKMVCHDEWKKKTKALWQKKARRNPKGSPPEYIVW